MGHGWLGYSRYNRLDRMSEWSMDASNDERRRDPVLWVSFSVFGNGERIYE